MRSFAGLERRKKNRDRETTESFRGEKRLFLMSIMQLTQTIHIMPLAYGKSAKQSMQPMLPGLEEEEATQPMVTNRQVAEVLSSIANLLEFQNSNPYRI